MNVITSIVVVVGLYLFIWKQRIGDLIVWILETVFDMKHEAAFYYYSDHFRGNKEIFFAVAVLLIFTVLMVRIFRWVTGYFREVNQGYLILAKVRVGAKEFVLAESPTAPSRFATWARTLTNDGDGPPNYYHGNYCSDRNAAILDFCNRARNQYEYEISVRRVAPHREINKER